MQLTISQGNNGLDGCLAVVIDHLVHQKDEPESHMAWNSCDEAAAFTLAPFKTGDYFELSNGALVGMI